MTKDSPDTATTESRPEGGLDAAPDAVARARAEVEAARETLGRWESEQATAQAELEALRERSGAALLDDPGSLDEVAGTISRLESRSMLAGKAAEAQRLRVMVAEAEYLAAEADALEPDLAAVEAALAEHDAKTARLLAQLERHEGRYISRQEHDRVVSQIAWQTGGVHSPGGEVGPPRSARMRNRARKLQRHITVLRELAAGRDPEPLLREWRTMAAEAYPDCVRGAGALVPTPAFLRSVDHARRRVDELEQAIEDLPARVEARRGLADQEGAVEDAHLQWLRARETELPRELAEARAHLAALESAGRGAGEGADRGAGLVGPSPALAR
ncbi:MAG: hypothetical protein CMH83_19035 [Nocardioides sp.]|nr:hypothetical protein [Nocardioides sp.]